MSDRQSDMKLGLTPQELCSTVEALWDMVHDRLFRTLRPTQTWKDLNWQTVQEILDSAIAAYSKAMDQVDPKFPQFYAISPVVWDALAGAAQHTHNIETCQLCIELVRMKLG